MFKILIIKSNKANLPEIEIYKKYFWNFAKINILDISSKDSTKNINILDYDIIWHFMGTDFFYDNIAKQILSLRKIKKNEDKNLKIPFLIHEYPSLSTGKFAKFKNFIKKKFNIKPNLRIFLNEKINKEFNFQDNVNFIYRDMGILNSFFQYNNIKLKKDYDFVYVGDISYEREIDKLLILFTKEKFKKYKILLIGKYDNEIFKKFCKYENIEFKGFLNYNTIPIFASRAVYGINWIPNKYPYNLQTSTKLLEYCSLDLKIINLFNDWSEAFAKDHDLKFYNIVNIKDFDIFKIENFCYVSSFDKIIDYEWINYLNKIKLKENLTVFLKDFGFNIEDKNKDCAHCKFE
jgi:hypothetical protein